MKVERKRRDRSCFFNALSINCGINSVNFGYEVFLKYVSKILVALFLQNFINVIPIRLVF